jgi:tRNA pseudouridine55 synthase
MTMRLGQTSTTGDPEGEITAVNDTQPSRDDILAALPQFTGLISQIPPAYSAIKVNGVRAYKLAREGKEVIIEARPVTIHRLELISYDYPEVKLIAEVSSGTYIRTLVEDLGKVLGAGAYTTALRRTTVGSYAINNAVQKDELSADTLERQLNNL